MLYLEILLLVENQIENESNYANKINHVENIAEESLGVKEEAENDYL